MSFFDEVLTTVENNRFLRAVQDSKTPITLNLRSSTDPTVQQKILHYGTHSSYHIKNALNLNLSLNWCFLKFLSSLQLLPSGSTFNPIANIPPLKRGKPQRYYFAPQVYVDGNSQIVTRSTIPSKLADKLQIDTTATPYTPIYQNFVLLKEKHKRTEAEVMRFEEEIGEDGLEAAQRSEQSRNQAPTQNKENSRIGNGSNNKNNKNGNDNNTNIDHKDEKDEDILIDESQLRISTATSHGTNASTLSFKKIGRILLRVLHYQFQPPQYRYHTAVNLWNELFVLIYSYQDQIKLLYKRIIAFREEQIARKTSYGRRLKDRLTRVYLNHDRYRRSRDQFTSPSMENARTPHTEQELAAAARKLQHDKKAAKQNNSAESNTKAIQPTARQSNKSLFESVSASSVGTTVPYESLPKPFTSVPMKEQSSIIATDPALLFLAYLLADGVLHHLHKTISDAIKAYDELEVQRLEKIAQTISPVPEQADGDRKNGLSTSRIGAFLTAGRHDPEESKRQQNEQIWLKRKSLIVRLQPFDGYYSGQNQSPHLATAAQQPLSTLQEEDDDPSAFATTPNANTKPQLPEKSPYNIFNGIEYISAQGTPHEDILSQQYGTIYFSPLLFIPLLRCPILYPLLEPLLLGVHGTSAQPNSPSAATPVASSEASSDATGNAPATNQLIPIQNTAVSTAFIDSQYFVFWVKVQEYLESTWSLDNDFNQFRVLGTGAFGTVTGVQHTKLLSVYAVKELSKRMVKASEKGYHFMVMNERRMLKSVHSPFVLHLHAALDDKEKLYLFTDICLGGDLSYHLKQQSARRFHYARARFYAAQIILGLEHMHARSIVYRDLKPSNILLDSEGNAKISDLGLSLRLPKNGQVLRHVAGTAGYWAPEIVSKRGTFTTSDYWSLGVMLYEMLCGHRPKLRTDIYAKRQKEIVKKGGRLLGGLASKNNKTPNAQPSTTNDDNSRQSHSISRSHTSQLHQSVQDDDSILRSSGNNLAALSGSGKDKDVNSLLTDGVQESILYQKFDAKMSKSFTDYSDAIKQQLSTQKQYANTKDYSNVPLEKINFRSLAMFAPNGTLLHPFEKQFIPQRFMILPAVLAASNNNNSIIAKKQPPTPSASTDDPHSSAQNSNNSSRPATPNNETSSPKHFAPPNGWDQPLQMNATPKQRSKSIKKTKAPPLPGRRISNANAEGHDPDAQSRSRNHSQNNNNNNNGQGDNGNHPPQKQPGNVDKLEHPKAKGGVDEYGQKKEEVGSIQTQMLDLLKQDDDGQDDPDPDLKKKKPGNELDDDDDDDDEANNDDQSNATNSSNNTNNNNNNNNTSPNHAAAPPVPPTNSPQHHQSQPTSPTSPNVPAKEVPLLNPIPPNILAGVHIKSTLYDKTKQAPSSGTSGNTFGTSSFQQQHNDRFIVGMTADKVPLREFRVITTADDNVVSGVDIQRAIDLLNNPLRWSPFDQGKETEIASRQDGSILDVDVDFNIDAAYLTTFAVDLFIRLFDPDPYTRLGAKGIDEIKQHPFFTTPIQGFGAIDWKLLKQQLIVPPYKPEANTVHAKTVDELANSPHDQQFKHIKLTPEDDGQYAKWYHTDQEHREKELVKILNNNVDINYHLWGSGERHNKSSTGGGGGCCEIM